MDAAVETVPILLVDDRPANLRALEAMLAAPDYELVCAESGTEALRKILSRDFAVLLLDVEMPNMDGFELASLIKQHVNYCTIPILFVTAAPGDRKHIFDAYRVGAVDYLEKPLDSHIVRSKVAVFAELYRQRREIRRQAEQVRDLEMNRLRTETDRRYRNLAEAIPQIVWIANERGEVEFLNYRWVAATGLTIDASLGLAFRRALHPEDAHAFEERWSSALTAESPLEFECRLGSDSLGYRWYLARACPELENGHAMRWLGTFTDVDDQKRAEHDARAAIAIRDEFLSIASHELRTPLTALQLQLQALSKSMRANDTASGPASPIRKLEFAVRQTRRLTHLTDSLLDVARITHGKLALSRETFDLAELARDVTERFREDAHRSGCAISIDGDPSVPGAWDRLRIEQVLTNLLSNALKYAAGTPIAVTVKLCGEYAALIVRDRGMGLSAEQIPQIFKRFERGVPAANYGGLGLGLYIAQQIASAHEGHIQVESLKGEGATFTVVLPRRLTIDRDLSLTSSLAG